ncbi:tetratricopeptide repeat-containing sensor histidine kinase [Flavobacterium sp.]|uniref:tetratricopeptide repeat-containing sensor histidine kinase n=1 Tax=Flavobacterium sp. TaxID=239 RepID=UPI002B4B848E|nr:ATP-binding protein [Flavobacterium sp.]HLF53234.1 ATP-binding protein [Flavobacterium sp.]
MKFNTFYSPFFILLFLVLTLSCTKNKSFPSQETQSFIHKINSYLDLSQSDSLSVEKKLAYINQSYHLAKKINIDSLIFKTMNKKGEFLNLNYPDNAFHFLKELEQLATLKKDTLYLGYSYLNLGDYYSGKKQDSIAFSYFNKSKTQFELKKDSSHVVYSLLMMSDILKNKDDYYDMEAVNTEALSFINQTNRNYNYSCVYNNLGISLKETYDYEKSLRSYKKARQYAEEESSRIIIDNNIASVFILNQQYQKAIDLLSKLEHSKSVIVNERIKSKILNNLGLAYFKLNDSRGLDYFLKALVIRENQKDEYGLISSYTHFANYYKSKNNSFLAKKYALKAYINATKMKSIDERLDALQILASSSSENESRDFSSTYFRLNDSIIKERQKSKNQFANIRYDFSNQKEQNLKLTTQKTETTLLLERQKSSTLLMYFVVLVLIALTVFIINFLNTKNKKEKIKASYNTETRISKKLHDELANDVYHAMTFAETQDLSTENNKEILLNDLDNIYSRTRNLSKENSSIDTGPNFVINLKEMMSNYSNDTVNVLVNGLDILQNTPLETNKKITVYRVLQELLVNMKKHSQCSLVVITFKKIDKKIQIEYTDNGIGAPPDKINLKSGLLNVENRINAINGNLTFDNTIHRGFKVSITFPI